MKHALRTIVAALLVLPLSGCPTVSPQTRTQVITVTRDRYVQIPAKMTVPCPIAPPGPTVGDAVEVARKRKAELEGCNAQLNQIQAVQGTPVEH